MSTESVAGGRYRIERQLGIGAMARVLLAHDEELGRPVAVKLLDEGLAADTSFRDRFSREARLAARLSHPNIVSVYDAGQDGDRPYIVMEYVEGPTLADRVRTEGKLRPEEVASIARQVCAGLEHAHSLGLVHRDMKPGNLIQRTDGTIKIADFGIARAAETTRLTDPGTVLGTAAYLAPEQATGGDVTSAADIYSLGVVLYELLTGKPPYTFESLAELGVRQRERPVREIAGADVPPDLERVVLACLAADPADRPQSAAQVASMLTAPVETSETFALSDDERTMVIPRARRRPAPPRRRVPVLPLALLALALGAVALGILALANDDDGGGGGEPPPSQEPRVQPLQPGETPEEDARNLAEWLRENSR